MTQRTLKLPAFNGVAAGQTATMRIATTLTYHRFMLAYSGVTLAQMDEIRLMANGQAIQRWTSGTVLDSVNKFDGMNAASGVINIDLDRYGLRTRAGQVKTALGCGLPGDPNPITSLSLEVDINAAAAAPVLSCRAICSDPSPSNLIKIVKNFGYDPAAAGEFEISDLPSIGDINRIILHSTAAVINRLRGQLDGYTFFDRDQATNEAIQADGVRVPQSNYYVIDFSEEGNGQDELNTRGINDVRWILDMAGAGHVDAIVEFIAPAPRATS